MNAQNTENVEPLENSNTENMQQNEIDKKIKKIVDEKKDIIGNDIINILAVYNNFIIYEINSPNIHSRLKVCISDTNNLRNEKDIQKKFNKVKGKYIKAKGMLLHSTNYETNKYRIAHTLSTYLSEDSLENPENDGKIFQDLMNEINEENKKQFIHKLFYFLAPIILFFLSAICLGFNCLSDIFIFGTNIQFFYFCLIISMGCGMGMFLGAKDLNFNVFNEKKDYFLLGLERIIFAILAGCSILIFLKSEILTISFIKMDNIYSTLLILLIASFSERLIPSLLLKTEQQVEKP